LSNSPLTFYIDVDGSNLAAFTYDAAARLQAMRGTVPFAYDAMGNRQSGNTQRDRREPA
jgi:hypothetical protein